MPSTDRVEAAILAKKINKTDYMGFQMALMAIPKIDLYAVDAADKLQDHLINFMKICEEHGQLPTQANYALSLHISRHELQRLLRGSANITDDVFAELHEANNMLGAVLEDNMLNGTNNVVGSIFVAKNNFGYRDQTEQIVVHQHQSLSAEQLKQLANNLPDVIDGEFEVVKDPEQIEVKDEAENEMV